MPKLQETNNGRFYLTIPKEVVKEKGWVKGQSLALIYDAKGNLSIGDNVPTGDK